MTVLWKLGSHLFRKLGNQNWSVVQNARLSNFVPFHWKWHSQSFCARIFTPSKNRFLVTHCSRPVLCLCKIYFGLLQSLIARKFQQNWTFFRFRGRKLFEHDVRLVRHLLWRWAPTDRTWKQTRDSRSHGLPSLVPRRRTLRRTTTDGMLRKATRDQWEQAHNSYELKTALSSSWSSSFYRSWTLGRVVMVTDYCFTIEAFPRAMPTCGTFAIRTLSYME